jgi:hypothetical protein
VEPKPHQIDAALFALQTPFLPGVILADEVGLGKTIEAGIVISQYWAERKPQHPDRRAVEPAAAVAAGAVREVPDPVRHPRPEVKDSLLAAAGGARPRC